LTYWGGCAVTGCKVFEALVAAHIKPWAKCSDRERMDQWNGLLLVGTLDRLFDSGLISFGDDGGMIISSLLTKRDLKTLGITSGSQLAMVDPRHKRYLLWHRKNVFVV
jgi:predicted restriction endonuclease